MNYAKLIKKIQYVLKNHPIHSLLFINLLIGYITLFAIFMLLLINYHCPKSSDDWVSENFSISFDREPKECKTTEAFCSKLLKAQEPLGKDFEDIINKNLWNL
jgi:hypothetical protein